MKKIIPLSFISMAVFLTACQSTIPATPTTPNQAAESNIQTSQAAENKKIVIDFYEGVFLKHQVKTYADRYIGNQYIQHNPHVPDGKAPFVDYFTSILNKILKQKTRSNVPLPKVIWSIYMCTLRKIIKTVEKPLLISSVLKMARSSNIGMCNKAFLKPVPTQTRCSNFSVTIHKKATRLSGFFCV
jgi:Uncharacterized protein conserved in bacteria